MIHDVATRLSKTTAISLRNVRPLCTAFLCEQAVCGPKLINEIGLNLENADYTLAKKATLWVTLDIISDGYPQPHASLLGFDIAFAELFLRGLARAMSSGVALNLTIRPSGDTHAVEYVTQHDVPLREYVPPQTITIRHELNCMLIGGQWKGECDPRPLFLLPRTDWFIKNFSLMSYKAIAILRDAVEAMQPPHSTQLLPKPTPSET